MAVHECIHKCDMKHDTNLCSVLEEYRIKLSLTAFTITAFMASRVARSDVHSFAQGQQGRPSVHAFGIYHYNNRIQLVHWMTAFYKDVYHLDWCTIVQEHVRLAL